MASSEPHGINGHRSGGSGGLNAPRRARAYLIN